MPQTRMIEQELETFQAGSQKCWRVTFDCGEREEVKVLKGKPRRKTEKEKHCIAISPI